MSDPTRLIPAAQYLRMSTDAQCYSLGNQRMTIGGYAEKRGFEIVQTYEDGGRSGLSLKGRDALKSLLADVLAGKTDFEALLVYDVSRWGRFQDPDQSAHYEWLIRSEGIAVHYCAEMFENDGSLSSSLMKAAKRVLAGEFSRDLSAKVFEGCSRLARRGYKIGGGNPYGYRRMLLDEFDQPKVILAPGQQKHLRSDHVTLVPGPPDEVATIRRIFRLSAWNHMSTWQIAGELNSGGIFNPEGRPWTGTRVAQIIRAERYMGVSIYGRYSKKLGGPLVRNDRSEWIWCENAHEPLVDARTFHAANRNMRKHQWRRTDEEMLEQLKSLYQELGRLTVRDVLAEPGFPTPPTIARRFGSFKKACALVGYVRPSIPYASCHPTLIHSASTLLASLPTIISTSGGSADHDTSANVVRIDDRITLGATFCRSLPATGHGNWRIRLRRGFSIDLLLVGLVKGAYDSLVGYALLPEARFGTTRDVYIADRRPRPINGRFEDLSELYQRLIGIGGAAA